MQSHHEIAPHIAQLAAEHTPTPLFQISAAGDICYANLAAQALLQMSDADLLGTPFLMTMEEGSRKKGAALLGSAQAQPSPPFEISQYSRGGEIITISYRAIALPQGQGMLVFGEPQTQLLDFTQQMLEHNQHLHSLMRVSSSISHTLDLREQLHATLQILADELQVNGAAVFLGEGEKRQLAAQHGMLHRLAQSHELWRPALERYSSTSPSAMIATGSPTALGLAAELLPSAVDTQWKIAITPITSDQGELGLLLVLGNSYPPFRASQIELLHTVGSLIGPPIENARLFSALRERTSQLQAVQLALNGIDTGMVLTDTSGVVRYVNATMGRLLNLDISQWGGQHRNIVMPALLQQTPQDQEAFTGDLWRYAGPPDVLLRRYHEMIYDPRGQLIGAVEVFSDVTLAQQMALMKDSFLSIAAHELKTPITAIKGYAQMALRVLGSQPEIAIQKQITMIDMISDELTRHMEDLLDVSRIQVGSLELDIMLTDIRALIQKAIDTMQFPTKRQRRDIQTSLPDEQHRVWWDSYRIERVLVNLINNALKYSPDGGAIQITAALVDEGNRSMVEIAVTDSGIGVPAEERQKIFERFYRSRQVVRSGFKGNGLGLFLCREIVEAHGGSIAAEAARHGGQGTTIAMRLPQDARRRTPA